MTVPHEASRGPGGDVVRLDISHRELAKIVGATPEALSRALKRLGEAGFVTVQGRTVTILDRSGLAREAGLRP